MIVLPLHRMVFCIIPPLDAFRETPCRVGVAVTIPADCGFLGQAAVATGGINPVTLGLGDVRCPGHVPVLPLAFREGETG